MHRLPIPAIPNVEENKHLFSFSFLEFSELDILKLTIFTSTSMLVWMKLFLSLQIYFYTYCNLNF